MCRHILQQLLSGNELTGAQTMSEEESNAAINAARQKYSLKLVDVNSTNKGSSAGGVQSFSAMVVVGNHEVCCLRRLAQLTVARYTLRSTTLSIHMLVVQTSPSNWSSIGGGRRCHAPNESHLVVLLTLAGAICCKRPCLQQ